MIRPWGELAYLTVICPLTLIACLFVPVWAIPPVVVLGLVAGAVVCLKDS